MAALARGYLGLAAYPFSSKTDRFLGFSAGLPFMLLWLGLLGIARNLLEVFIGGAWANLWFALKPDIFFTMFCYPVFLCFFSTTLLYFFSRLLKLEVKIGEILSLCFLLQVSHLFIPFFDGLAGWLSIPYNYLLPVSTYRTLLFSPLAFTPLIMFFTRPTSLGIDLTWLWITFILVKLFCRHYRFSVWRSLTVLAATFYILYMSIYPNYSFFLNERVIGSNVMFGLFFLFMSIPSVMFVSTVSRLEKD
jgi:hypothetical protein